MALLDNVTQEQMGELLNNLKANSTAGLDDPNDSFDTYDFKVDGEVVYSLQGKGSFGDWMNSNPKFEEVTIQSGLWDGPSVDYPNMKRFAIFSNQNPINVYQLIAIWDTENQEIIDVLSQDPSVEKN